MSIIESLITDRTQADVTKLKSLLSKPKAMWTTQEWSDFILAKDKGAYNATDLNRVQEAMEYLAERFRGYGYNVPEIKRPSITEVIPGTSRLPEGYTELEYIRSTGTQYVDTAFKPNQDTSVVMDSYMTAESFPSFFYGSRNGAFTVNYGLFVNSSGVRSTYGTSTLTMTGASVYERAQITKNKNVCSVNDVTVTNTVETFQSDFNLFLFASNEAGTEKYFGFIQLYSCQIYDNGTLIRDYVPCLNPSKEVGLYDIVNGVFYGNAGTGYFLPGPAVSLPEGYTRLEYIQSTGEQYVDTGFVPNQDTRAVLTVQLMGTNSNFFGSRSSTSSNAFTVSSASSGGVDYWRHGYNSASPNTTIAADTSEKHVLDANKNVLYLDGVAIKTQTYAAFTCPVTATIGVIQSASKTYPGSARFYEIQLYDNDVLSRLYTPVLTASGDIGLYDSITGAFFGNAGTGVFVAGDELGSSDGNIPTQIIERDYWKIGDIPRKAQMDTYLSNLGVIRGINEVLKSTPEIPGDMEGLLHTEANNIEQILIDVDYLLSVMVLNWFYTAEVFCGEV